MFVALFTPEFLNTLMDFFGLSEIPLIVAFFTVFLLLSQLSLKYLTLFADSSSDTLDPSAGKLKSYFLKLINIFRYDAKRATMLLKIFLIIDAPLLALLALALSASSILSLAGVGFLEGLVTVSTTAGIIGVIGSLPLLFLTYKVLLPKALLTVLSWKNDTFEKTEKNRKNLERSFKIIAHTISLAVLVTAVTLWAINKGPLINLCMISAAWVIGLGIGHYLHTKHKPPKYSKIPTGNSFDQKRFLDDDDESSQGSLELADLSIDTSGHEAKKYSPPFTSISSPSPSPPPTRVSDQQHSTTGCWAFFFNRFHRNKDSTQETLLRRKYHNEDGSGSTRIARTIYMASPIARNSSPPL